MASKRMISKNIYTSGRFLTMPQTAQNLYAHLSVHADDDGLVEAFMVMRLCNANEDDLRILDTKGFVKILNTELVTYIIGWQDTNIIRSAFKYDSQYQKLLLETLDKDSLPKIVKSRSKEDNQRRVEQRRQSKLTVSDDCPPRTHGVSTHIDLDLDKDIDLDIDINIPLGINNMPVSVETGEVESKEQKFKYTLTMLRDDITEIIGKKFRTKKPGSEPSKQDIKDATNLKQRMREGAERQDFRDILFNLQRDNHHRDSGFKWVTTEFVTRSTMYEKWLNAGGGEFGEDMPTLQQPSYNQQNTKSFAQLQDEYKLNKQKRGLNILDAFDHSVEIAKANGQPLPTMEDFQEQFTKNANLQFLS